MIQVLGVRRVVIMGVLAGINILLLALIYLFFVPHNEQLTNQLQTLTSQVTSKRSDANRLRGEYQIIQDQKVYFENLRGAGFFLDQNRSIARQRIDEIQKFTNILAARYNIGAAIIEKIPAADDSGDVVLNSHVKVDIDALDDVDFYNFVYWIENAFPGHVSIDTLDVSRQLDVGDVTLREIGNGTPTILIKGSVEFDWRTMIPASQIAPVAPKG